MGAVYVGRDTQLDRRVAFKVFTVADKDGRARMAEEARILARLEHPGIVPVHDLGRLPDDRIFYYAVKMVEGGGWTRMRGRARRPTKDCAFSRASVKLHSEGIIHRDLKPENIMVGRSRRSAVARLGRGQNHRHGQGVRGRRRSPRSETARGTVIGTADFMAPEQAAGALDQVDARSDIFSLGRTLAALV